jgi:hypothetical protein
MGRAKNQTDDQRAVFKKAKTRVLKKLSMWGSVQAVGHGRPHADLMII